MGGSESKPQPSAPPPPYSDERRREFDLRDLLDFMKLHHVMTAGCSKPSPPPRRRSPSPPPRRRSPSPPPRRRSPSPPPRRRSSPPPPTFDKPWRTLAWRKNDENLQYAMNYQPDHDEVTHLRVMVYGPVGPGKSSFINSVSSTLRGKASFRAGVGPTQGSQSWTTKYQTHRIKRGGRGDYYKIVFNDIMGVESGSGRGVHVEDIILAMKGHMRDNYKFNPRTPLSRSDPDYIQEPSPDDKVHVLVCVCPANITEIKDSTLTKMNEIREAARDLGIPQLLIVTKVDEACPETKKNLQNVYRSNHIKRKMEELGIQVGIPMNCILPVKNYSEEISNDPDIDTLILSVLKLILDIGDENLDKL